MRLDYWKSNVPLRLGATKAVLNKLAKIQRAFFPSFSQSSVVKILFGVFAMRHRIRPVAFGADGEESVQAPEGTPSVEVVDCTEDDLRLILACNSVLAKGKKGQSNLLSTVVRDFSAGDHGRV